MRVAPVMIHHEGTKGTEGSWGSEGIGERSHHRAVGVVRVHGAFHDWEPSVAFVPSW